MCSVCSSGEGQRQLCNEHERVHGIKFQSFVCPDGMIANLYGILKDAVITALCLPDQEF